jgi:hypothetical protein
MRISLILRMRTTFSCTLDRGRLFSGKFALLKVELHNLFPQDCNDFTNKMCDVTEILGGYLQFVRCSTTSNHAMTSSSLS